MTGPEPRHPLASGATSGSPPRPRTSEELRLVFEQAAIAIWSVDRDLRFTHRRLGDLVRLRNVLGDCYGMTLAERIGSDDPAHPILQAHLCALEGQEVRADFEFDGRIYHTHLEPMRDESETIVGVMGVGIDATDEREIQRAVAESEERYRRLAELLPEALVVHTEGVVLYANPATARLVDTTSPAQLRGTDIRQFFAREDHEALLRRVRDVYAANAPTGLNEWRVVARDGTEHVMELASAPIAFEGRKAVLTVSRDITARRHAEEELRKSHHLLEAVVRGTTDSVWVKDVEGRYLKINEAGARAVGRTPEEMVGLTDFDIHPRDTAEAIRLSDVRAIAAGTPITVEETMEVNGEPRIWLATKGAFRDGKGQVCGVVGISRDMTTRRRLEEQLRQSQKIEAVGRLAGGIAHDFNNLLAIIKSYADFLVQSLPPDDARHDDVEEIRAAADRAAVLTRQLLVFSRRQVVAPEALDLNRVVVSMERMLRPLLLHEGEMRLALHPGLWPTRADAGQIEQVLLNLAVNARDAMPGGGVLMIETANVTLDEDAARARGDLRPGDYVALVVRDTGIGMDEATRSRVFEPFFTTKPMGQGTGLGLPTVYAIVQAAGGHVGIISAPGRGTTVSVLLPRTSGDEEREPQAAQRAPRPRGAGGTILLVDDDPQMRSALSELLEEEGYGVIVVTEPGQAVRIALEHAGAIDLLLADDLLPTMSGRALAQRLTELRPSLRVLLVSSVGRSSLEEGEPLPMHVRVVPRTASPEELLTAIRGTLAQRAPGEDAGAGPDDAGMAG